MASVKQATCLRAMQIAGKQNISELKDVRPENINQKILTFLGNGRKTPEFRTGIAMLILHGRYPNSLEFNSVLSLVSFGDFETALERIKIYSPKRSQRLMPLLVSESKNQAIFDVSRYSAEPNVSGIPRVVKNLVTSSIGRKLSVAVWNDHRFTHVDIHHKSGEVLFPKSLWSGVGGQGLTKWLLARMRAIALISPWFAYIAYQLISAVPISKTRRFSHPRQPRANILLSDTTLVVAEVMSREVADWLLTWQRVGTGLKTRFIVHDLLPLTRSEFFTPSSSHEHLHNMSAYCEAEFVFVATPLLAKDLKLLAISLGLEPPKTRIFPLPINPNFSTPEHKTTDKPYFLLMGGFDLRKRSQEFIDYVIAHRDQAEDFEILVISKPILIANKHDLSLLQRLFANQKIFKLVWGVTDKKLAELYANATATIYVSTAEGYGLPILESLSFRTPVISSATELNKHLNSIHGGQLMCFDRSDQTIRFMREMIHGDLRETTKSSIRTRTIPTDIESWAKEFLKGLN